LLIASRLAVRNRKGTAQATKQTSNNWKLLHREDAGCLTAAGTAFNLLPVEGGEFDE